MRASPRHQVRQRDARRRLQRRLGRLGLARLTDHDELPRTTDLAGTIGYMAPEMMQTGRATKETEVYAFGIMVLEVVCGRKALDTHAPNAADYLLLDCVWRAHEAGDITRVADERLSDTKPPILRMWPWLRRFQMWKIHLKRRCQWWQTFCTWVVFAAFHIRASGLPCEK